MTNQPVRALSIQPKLGLALGGGSTRSIAHIGVLKVLERENIPVDYLAGTSAGGVIAALHAHGLSAAEIEAEMVRLGHVRRFVSMFDIAPGPYGPIQGKQVHDYFQELFGTECTFADLQKPVAVTAVDLVTGELVVLNEGLVADAMRATASLPGLFTPTKLNGQLLVDGGVLNNVPTDVVRAMGADIVIAVDVGLWHTYKNHTYPWSDTPFGGRSVVPIALRQFWRALTIMMAQQVAHNLQDHPPDVLIQPEISADFVLFSGMHRVPELVAAGEAAMEEALPVLFAAIDETAKDEEEVNNGHDAGTQH